MKKAAACTLLLLNLSLGLTPQAFAALERVLLPSLSDDSWISLEDFQGKVVLLNFFEPDCSWCYRQMKAFNQIFTQCSHQLQPLSVGIHGNKERLRHELRRAKVAYPAALGTSELQQWIGEVPATPWTLIIGPHGELLGKLQGFIKQEQLLSIFSEFCP